MPFDRAWGRVWSGERENMIVRLLVVLSSISVGGETESSGLDTVQGCVWDGDRDGELTGLERYKVGDQLCYEDPAANLVIGQCRNDGRIAIVETCELLAEHGAFGCSSASIDGQMRASCDFTQVGL